MSRSLRKRKSAWVVIDETESEGDNDRPSPEEDSDYEVEYLSKKAVAKKNNKVPVVDLDEPNCKAFNNDKDESTKSKSATAKKEKKRTRSEMDGKKEATPSTKTNVESNEIIIDDDDNDDIEIKLNIPVKNRIRKERLVDTDVITKIKTTKISSKKKSDVDDVGENRSTKDKDKIPVISIDKPNDKARSKDKDVRPDFSTSGTEKRKKELKTAADLREKQKPTKNYVRLSSCNEIIIDDDDDEDMKLEASIPSISTMRKAASPDTLDVRRTKRTEAFSSKRKLDVDEIREQRSRVKSGASNVNDDEKVDLDDVVDYRSSKKTKKRDKDRTDEPNRKNKSNEIDLNRSASAAKIEVRKRGSRTKADVREEQKSAAASIKLLSGNRIIIDDEHDEDIKLEKSIPKRSIKRKEVLPEKLGVKRSKTTEASQSKQKVTIDKTNQNSYAVDSESDKFDEDGDKDSDSVVEYQSSTKSKDAAASRNIESKEIRKKRFNSKAEIREEDGSSDIEVTLMSSNEITIDDDEDAEDMKLEIQSEIPVKNTKRKASRDTAASAKKVKTAGESDSKKKLVIDEADKTLSPVNKGNDKPIEVEKPDMKEKVDAEWTDSDYLSEFNQIEQKIAENLISLFKDDNTIPFIARYRKEMTGGMEPEQLRNIKNTYDNLKLIKQRALVILKSIDKLGKWSPEIHSAVTAAKTIHELEHIYAPFKPGAKGSLAERAKELGLGPIGETILRGRAIPSLSSLVDKQRKGLGNETEVKQGIIHIIADVINKDKTTFEGIHNLRRTAVINIECTRSKSASSSKGSKNAPQNVDPHKYENYFKFSCPEKRIKDYQILAINRGEAQKILSVKIVPPSWFQQRLRDHCLQKYAFVRKVSNFHYSILEESFDDAYNRLIKPLIMRQIRHDLNERAERAAIEVFAGNLKKLLLIPPLKGKTILGIDPGFTHGCKLAVISQCGNVLDTATIYPHTRSKFERDQQGAILVNLIKKHYCTIVALGNATACRETEMFLTNLMQAGAFAPLDVSYTIVNESGASIYSCSSEAKSEFPTLDPNIISAISIARRLQDPLAELIKVEPKHLGIGMYQHDLPKKQLQLTLDEVVTETVSFVGVDINTASHCLLRKVAGLSAARATNIILRRDQRGPFTNRKELLEVKGIGKKFFEQCAGFIRILPETALPKNGILPSEKLPLDYLDQTWIHPESYNVARRFLEACKCDMNYFGTENFIGKILSYAKWKRNNLAIEFGTTDTSMDIIVKGLSMRKGEDIRVKEDGPVFKRNLRCMDDLCENTKVTGVVTNVTHFGTFVDIGVGKAGLIPLRKSGGQTLSLGQRVEVVVFSIDRERQRIILSLESLNKVNE